MPALLDVPDDVFRKLLPSLAPRDAAALSCACPRFNRLLRSDQSYWIGAAEGLGISGITCGVTGRRAVKRLFNLDRKIRDGSWGNEVLLAAQRWKDPYSDDLEIMHTSFVQSREFERGGPGGTLVADGRKYAVFDSQGRLRSAGMPPQLLVTAQNPDPVDMVKKVLETFLDSPESQPSRVFLFSRCRKEACSWPSRPVLAPPPLADSASLGSIRSFQGLSCPYLGQSTKNPREHGLLGCLDLSGAHVAGGSLSRLSGSFRSLRSLVLAHQDLSDWLAKALLCGGHLRTCEVLDLSFSRLEGGKAGSFAVLLKHQLATMTCLKALLLRSTRLGPIFSGKWPSRFQKVISRLEYLDVSELQDLSQDGMRNIVTNCASLKTLLCGGCQSLCGENGGEMHVRDEAMQRGPFPSRKNDDGLQLSHFSCGWGFGPRMLRRLCCDVLTTLQIGPGAIIADAILQDLSIQAPHLQKLGLTLCTVSSKGVSQVLRRCGWLNTLHIVNCTGPFGNDLVEGLQDKYRSGLKELHLVWGSVSLSATSFQVLIGTRRPTLEWLELVGCKGMTNDHLAFLQHTHAETLHTVRLENCTWDRCPTTHLQHLATHSALDSVQVAECAFPSASTKSCSWLEAPEAGDQCPGGGSKGTSPNQGSSDHQAKTLPMRQPSSQGANKMLAFDEQHLAKLLLACPRMRHVQLRHCCQLSKGMAARLATGLPLLEYLMLDRCDVVDGNYDLVPMGGYHPLQYIQVARCSEAQPIARHPCLDVNAPETVAQRRSDLGSSVHDLLRGLSCFESKSFP